MSGNLTESTESTESCGIFSASFDGASDNACFKVLSISIGGTALPLCFIILGLICIYCYVAMGKKSRKSEINVSEEGVSELKEFKGSDTNPNKDKCDDQPKGNVGTNDNWSENDHGNDDLDIDAGLYDSIDIIEQMKKPQEVANPENDQDGDNYDYISNNQQVKRAHNSVPQLSSSKGNDEPRPYEEFVKQEQPVYALPNKCHKSKQDLTEDLADRTHEELADDSSGPPLPPPIALEDIPAGVNASLQGTKIVITGDSNDGKRHHEEEKHTLYKNVHQENQRSCRSLDQLVPNAGEEAVYYNTVSREKLNVSSTGEESSDLYDQPPKVGVESSEVHEQMYMNI